MATKPHVPSVIMFFKIGETGWSEQHLYVGAGVNSLYDLQPIASQLAFLRSAMLAYGITLYRVRTSYIDVWRDSLYAEPPIVSIGNVIAFPTVPVNTPFYNNGQVPLPPGDPWDVVLFRLGDGSQLPG